MARRISLPAWQTVPSAAPPPITPDRNPSRWSRRLPVAALALLGCGIATYLALYQYGVVGRVWDPLFGTGSEQVLTSSLSRALPVPDAVFGAVAYLVEAVAELAGGRDRWYRQARIVFGVGLVAAVLALTGLELVVLQPVLTGTFCTLCLASAAISFAVAALVVEEVRAAIASLRPGPSG